MNFKSTWIRFLPAVLLVLGLVFTQQKAALASLPADSTFELDGNACQDASGQSDWATITGFGFAGQGHCTANSGSPGTPVAGSFIDDRPAPAPSADATYFKSGSSKIGDPLSGWFSGGSAPNKAEIEHSFAAQYSVNNQPITYFGQDRSANNGDTNIGFWFFRNSVVCCNASKQFIDSNGNRTVHSDGDDLILSDFTTGGRVGTIQLYQWRCTSLASAPTGALCGSPGAETGALQSIQVNSTAATSDCSLVNRSTVNLCAIINQGNINVPWDTDTTPNGTLGFNEFFEGAVNLPALTQGGACFSSYMGVTDSAQSTANNVEKDFALGSFDTCAARVTISPHEATNSVGQPHTLTVGTDASSTSGSSFTSAPGSAVSVKIASGSGKITGGNCFASAAKATLPSAGPVSGTTANSSNVAIDGSSPQAAGTCTVIITQSTVGTTTVHADATVSVGGQTKSVSTSATATDNTGDAIKHYVAGSLTVHKSVEVGPFAGYPQVCFALSYHSPSATGDINITPISTDAATAAGVDPSYSPVNGANAALNTNKECHQYSAGDTVGSVTSFDFKFHGLASSHYDLTESIVPNTAPWNLARTDNLTNIAVDATAATDGSGGASDPAVTACSAATVAPACDQPANPLKPGHLTIVKTVNGAAPTSGSFSFSVFSCNSTSTARTLNQDGSVATVGTCNGESAAAVDTETLQSSNSYTATTGNLPEGYYLVHETPPATSTGYAVDPTTQNQVVQVYAGDCKIVNGACDPSVTSAGLTATVNNKLLYNIVVATCQQSSNTLVQSEVDLSANNTTYRQNSAATGSTPANVNENSLCQLSRANFQHLLPSTGTSSYGMNVHLNVPAGSESNPISP